MEALAAARSSPLSVQQCARFLILVLPTSALLLGWELGERFPVSLSFCFLLWSQGNLGPGHPGRASEMQRETVGSAFPAPVPAPS